MNCVKIVSPLPVFINIYYYYSTFTLCSSLIITPLLFYIIFTKSKDLKSFKWLLLNHTFWCFCFELFYTTLKPIFLPPALSGYSLGILRNGNYKITTFAMFFIIGLMVSMTVSVGLTLINRYLAAFPINETNKNLLKFGFWFLIIAGFISYIADGASFHPIFMKNISEIYAEAIAYDPCLEYFSTNEPAFLFIPYEFFRIYLIILFIIFTFLITFAFSLNIYFIRMIKSQKSQTLAKLQLSLTISATIQLSVTVIFLLFPTLIFVAFLCFQIQNCENLLLIVFCFFVSHSLLESIVTLYFVTPYRKGVKQIFGYFLSFVLKPLNNSISTGLTYY